MTEAQETFTVDRWGQPPAEATKPRRSKYLARIEVVRERNKTEPETWGVIAEFDKEASARSRQSLVKKEYSDLDLAVNFDGEVWLLWARRKPRKRVQTDG